MRLQNEAHTSRPWRIHELTRDFKLEDVWALPTPGGPDAFPRLVELMTTAVPGQGSSRVARTLWAVRWKVGAWLGWDDPDTGTGAGAGAGTGNGPGTGAGAGNGTSAGAGARVPTLRDRLPDDLRAAVPGPVPHTFPFKPLYRLEDEWAAEIVNKTVHGVLHLAWVADADAPGGHRGQMAVYAKPNGRLGRAYMAAIMPFRHRVVYPPMLRDLGRRWRATERVPAAR